MAALAIVATVAGAAMSAYGSYESGQAQRNQALYQSAVATNNQTIANQYAQTEIQRGQVLEQEKREQTAQMISSERATIGANGLDINTGSPLRLQESVAKLGELDAQTIRNNALRSAYGYQVQGMNFGAEAGLFDAEAANAARAGNLGMWSNIMAGASGTAFRWNVMAQEGSLPPFKKFASSIFSG